MVIKLLSGSTACLFASLGRIGHQSGQFRCGTTCRWGMTKCSGCPKGSPFIRWPAGALAGLADGKSLIPTRLSHTQPASRWVVRAHLVLPLRLLPSSAIILEVETVINIIWSLRKSCCSHSFHLRSCSGATETGRFVLSKNKVESSNFNVLDLLRAVEYMTAHINWLTLGITQNTVDSEDMLV